MENSKRKMTEKEAALLKDKEEMMELWEECFDEKVTEVVTDEGIKKIYSNETTIEEAGALLTDAAKALIIHRAINSSDDSIGDMVIKALSKVIGDKDDEFKEVHKVIFATSKEDAIEKLKKALDDDVEDDSDDVDALKGACECGSCGGNCHPKETFIVHHEGQQVGGLYYSFEEANKYAVGFAIEHGFQRTEMQILELKGHPTVA